MSHFLQNLEQKRINSVFYMARATAVINQPQNSSQRNTHSLIYNLIELKGSLATFFSKKSDFMISTFERLKRNITIKNRLNCGYLIYKSWIYDYGENFFIHFCFVCPFAIVKEVYNIKYLKLYVQLQIMGINVLLISLEREQAGALNVTI